MKNIIILSAAGMGDRYAMGAPTFWTTMNGYARAGWRVWIFNASINDGAEGRRDYDDGVHLVQKAPIFRREAKLRTVGYFFSEAQYRWIRSWQRKQAEALIAREGLDASDTVIYGDEVLSVPAARDVSRRHRMKLVTRFCGVWDMLQHKKDLRSRLRDRPWQSAYATAADLTIMTDDGTRGDEVLRRAGNRSRRVCFWRNGVDLPPEGDGEIAEIPGIEPGDRVLMTLSRLHPGKRVDRAIRALGVIRREHPNVKLVVCGYGSERERLEAVTAQEHLEDAVIFTGQIPHDRIYSYLRRADMFLSFYEASNLGNPLFEAMRCALPIVTLDTGATGTVITDGVNGLLLPPEDLDRRIPEAICRLLDDHALAGRLGEAAAVYAREHFRTWDERVAAETDAVAALLPENGGRE